MEKIILFSLSDFANLKGHDFTRSVNNRGEVVEFRSQGRCGSCHTFSFI
jgi:hypothetical protein